MVSGEETLVLKEVSCKFRAILKNGYRRLQAAPNIEGDNIPTGGLALKMHETENKYGTGSSQSAPYDQSR